MEKWKFVHFFVHGAPDNWKIQLAGILLNLISYYIRKLNYLKKGSEWVSACGRAFPSFLACLGNNCLFSVFLSSSSKDCGCLKCDMYLLYPLASPWPPGTPLYDLRSVQGILYISKCSKYVLQVQVKGLYLVNEMWWKDQMYDRHQPCVCMCPAWSVYACQSGFTRVAFGCKLSWGDVK